jgi:hypothetical protein
MKIEISDHARQRIKRYGLDEKLVIAAMRNPDEIMEGYEGRKIAHKSLNHYILRIIYEEYDDEIVVVTVYPAEKRRY